jgi:hypothetical protein
MASSAYSEQLGKCRQRGDQWRQGDPIERYKATSASAAAEQVLDECIEDHSFSGSLDWPVEPEVPLRQWNFSRFQGYSDFFTLDPNLASALRRTCAGVFSAAKAQPERGQATPEDGLGGETGVE